MKPELIDVLLKLMGASYHLYYRAHAFHWNVLGSNFHQYHDFFGEVADAVYAPVDDIAENVRKLSGFPPANFPELLSLVPVSASTATDAMDQMSELQQLNAMMGEMFRQAIRVADDNDEPAISNFLQERLDYHQKLNWKLTSLLTYTV